MSLFIYLLLLGDLPEPLQRSVAARAAIQTADVRWSVMDTQSWTNPGDVVRYRTFHGGPDTALFPLDQYEGVPVKRRDEHGNITEIAQAPTAYLLNADGLWEYRVDGGVAFQFDVPFPPLVPLDVRLIGMSTGLGVLQRSIDNLIDTTDVTFSEESRDGFHVVTAHYLHGDGARYFIDADLGWNVVRIENFDQTGALRWTVDTTYELRNGCWFPSFCQSTDERSGEIRFILQVEDADVNDPTLPPRLEPEHIGIQNCMTVVPVYRGQPQLAYVDGQLLPRDDAYLAARRDGRIQPGAKTVEFNRNKGRMTPSDIDDLRQVRVERSTDAWERYTRRFIEQYRLDEKQRSMALDILKKCQDERDDWLRENRGKIADRLAAQTPEQASKASADGTNRPSLESRLLKPVQRIFDEKLKPRLFKLPTDDQIDACRDPEGIRNSRK